VAAELLTRGQPGGQEEAPSFSFLILPLLAPLFFFFNILNSFMAMLLLLLLLLLLSRFSHVQLCATP